MPHPDGLKSEQSIHSTLYQIEEESLSVRLSLSVLSPANLEIMSKLNREEDRENLKKF